MRCTCGQPETLGVVHCRTRPCFHYVEREWVGLTDEEIRKIEYSDDEVEYELFDEGEYGYEINIYPRKFARAIEAKLKEKNT